MVAQSQPAVHPLPVPYAVLYFPELLEGQVDQRALLLPLTFAYLLSMHVRFVLPASLAAVPALDKILDEILTGHSLVSKGLVYMQIAHPEQLEEVLRKPVLLVTSASGANAIGDARAIPQAVIFTQEGKGPNVRLRNAEKISDEDLKGKLVGCAQLINIQSGGFFSEGHFSLSW